MKNSLILIVLLCFLLVGCTRKDEKTETKSETKKDSVIKKLPEEIPAETPITPISIPEVPSEEIPKDPESILVL